ncbi:hypothetical protein F53441_8041 [Fusarium austroafricanum]|uniref:Hydrophobin n=1 Tax=Fusarium austroafricanum TaxID=2364996 RepID=A0A8H4KF24_9HYPO|nr:hypothetical protein F53441_8041 [Fusarium austroafricanum]
MQFSTIFYAVAFMQGAMASPVAEPEHEVETRDLEPRGPALGDYPWPRLPSVRRGNKKGGNSKDCPAPTNQQGNACSSGTQFCCTTSADGVQTCSNSEVCNAKIICCNNNSGFQMCIGEIDFNAPVTININIYKGGKGGKGGYKAIKD